MTPEEVKAIRRALQLRLAWKTKLSDDEIKEGSNDVLDSYLPGAVPSTYPDKPTAEQIMAQNAIDFEQLKREHGIDKPKSEVTELSPAEMEAAVDVALDTGDFPERGTSDFKSPIDEAVGRRIDEETVALLDEEPAPPPKKRRGRPPKTATSS